jgi:hypothetical protein
LEVDIVFYAVMFVNNLATGDYKGPYNSVEEANEDVYKDIPEDGGWWIINSEVWKDWSGEQQYGEDNVEFADEVILARVPPKEEPKSEEEKDGE